MDLLVLEQFLRIAELGSINRAAKELGLSQAALSRSVSHLERDLGCQLIVRCRTGVTITEAGSVFVSRAESLLREVGTIREELAADPAGRVVLGMPAALRQLVTLPAAQAMRKESPGTTIRIYEGFNVFLGDMLKQGILDVAVIALGQMPDEGCIYATQVREPIVLARNSGLPKCSDPARIADVVEFPLALPARPNVLRKMIDRAIRERNLSAKITVEPENLELCLDLVRSGIVGQTVTIGSALGGKNVSGLRMVPIESWSMLWAVAAHRQQHHTVAVRRLATIVANALTDAAESGIWWGASIVSECGRA